MRNAVDKLVGGRDEVHGHDEGDALAERRPVIIAPRRPVNAPFTHTIDERRRPRIAHQQHIGRRR